MGRLRLASRVCRTRHRVSGVADEWLPILLRQVDRTRLTGRLVTRASPLPEAREHPAPNPKGWMIRAVGT